MVKSIVKFIKEIIKEFSLDTILSRKMTNSLNGVDEYVSCYRPINGRGRDQLKCLLAYIKKWVKTGDNLNYCEECKYHLVMTCMESSGFSRECRRGHYRFEAT